MRPRSCTQPSSSNDATWLSQLYGLGVKDSFDVAATHPYQGMGDAPPEFADDGHRWWFTHTPAVRAVMVANGDAAKQIWATEFGAPTGRSRTSLTEAAQAQLVTLAYTKLQAWRWAGPGFLHSYRDRGKVGASTDDGFGLVRADWSKKPSYRAYKRRAGARGG